MVETTTATFNADWASPPGDLIEEIVEERGWTKAELAVRLDFSPKHVNELLKGRASITADTAERLERVLGHEAGFWMRLEANYQQDTSIMKKPVEYWNGKSRSALTSQVHGTLS
jgi:HTH-type transcriptional regulator/antitoxin HigA